MAKNTKAMTIKKTLEQRYLDFLADEGYRPRGDPDADDLDFRVITFKSEGSTFLLFVYEDDPDYFNVGFSFDLGEAAKDPAALARLALHVNGQVKGVKCTLGHEDSAVRFQVESFLCGSKVSHALLKRSLDALRHAAAAFFEKRVPPEHLDA
ncbi:MAG: YbjN domain-containing protein [Anaeromyxobacteraceae bacterium]